MFDGVVVYVQIFSCLRCIICDCCGCLNCQQAFKTADESSADATVVKDAVKTAAGVSKDVKKATEKTKKLDIKSDVMFHFIPPSFAEILIFYCFRDFDRVVLYFMKIVIIIKSFWFPFLKFSVQMFYHSNLYRLLLRDFASLLRHSVMVIINSKNYNRAAKQSKYFE